MQVMSFVRAIWITNDSIIKLLLAEFKFDLLEIISYVSISKGLLCIMLPFDWAVSACW